MGHKAPQRRGARATPAAERPFLAALAPGGLIPGTTWQESRRVPRPSQASEPTGPSLTSPRRCLGGAPPQPALGPGKIILGTRFCMGILKNVPTATKRLGWTARTAGSSPGVSKRWVGSPYEPWTRDPGSALAAGALARASLITGAQWVRSRGRLVFSGCARAGASDYRGSSGCARAGDSEYRRSSPAPPRERALARACSSVACAARTNREQGTRGRRPRRAPRINAAPPTPATA